MAVGIDGRRAGSDAAGSPRQAEGPWDRGERQFGVAVLRPPRYQLQKNLHAAEQDRQDVRLARTEWKQEQPRLDPSKLVFIDETGTSTNMTRLRGRCPRGRRLVAKVPHGHWKMTTFVAGLRNDRM